MTWEIKIAEFLIQMELFPSNQSNGKQLAGSQLIGPRVKLIISGGRKLWLGG